MKPTGPILASFAAGFLLLAAFGAAQEAITTPDRLFPEKVAPILQKHCLACHNADKARGGLDLSTRATLLEGGDKGPVIEPGNAKASRLYQMIAGPMPKMPRQADPLSDADVALIARWLDAGAPWPEELSFAKKKVAEGETWWSLRPLQAPLLPKVSDPSWCKTPIDHFILAMLEAKGMRPSTHADRLTYLRRVKYDLHGLPPTPEEIDEFNRDCDARDSAARAKRQANGDVPDEAVLRLIDRLLQSPQYGERWGRHWLDIVHFADTHGYDKDKRRLWAWLFRDWAIRALNRDLPFRRFVQYQLAGDVLFPDDPDGVIATGFVVAGPWDFVGHVELREGTVDKEKTRLDRDDMVSNTIATFNSLTVHCARCHEHKFDPISMKDYYQLQAVFAGVERGDRPVATQAVLDRIGGLERKRHETIERGKRLFANSLASPKVKVIADQQLALSATPSLGIPFAPRPSTTNGYHSAISKQAQETKWVQVDLGEPASIDLIKLIPAHPTDFADTPGFGFPLRFRVELADDADFAMPVTLVDETRFDYPNPGANAVAHWAAGRKARYVRVTAERLWKRTNDHVFALAELQVMAEGRNVALGKRVAALDSIEAGRWSTAYLVDDRSSRRTLPDYSQPGGKAELQREVLAARLDKELREAVGERVVNEMRELAQQQAALAAEIEAAKVSTQTYGVLSIQPRSIHIFARGDVERPGARARPGALTTIFPKLDRHFASVKDDVAKPQAEGARRAALAHWLCDDDNVLTWRSIVNRVWHYHFGKGLVDTPNDFGKNGSLPSHPELLDWLACDFRDHGDSLKRLHKMIVTSAAYRQSSAYHADYAKLDSDNRYLWRMNRTRLDAESIRDSVLAVSGKMNGRMHGPGYDLFRFKDDHSPVYDHLDVAKSTHPDTWRRTVYRFVVRSVPNPFLETLDCADPNINVPVRNTTVTALQALALLNNPFMIQQLEFFAERLRGAASEPAKQVDAAYLHCFGRTPTAQERAAFVQYIERHGLANACRLLMNANEFIFVD